MQILFREIFPLATWVFLGLGLVFFVASFFVPKRRGHQKLYRQGVLIFVLAGFLSFAYPIVVGFLDGYFLS